VGQLIIISAVFFGLVSTIEVLVEETQHSIGFLRVFLVNYNVGGVRFMVSSESLHILP